MSEDLLFEAGALVFRKQFTFLKTVFEMPDNLSVYSLRRGGVTWNFLQHGSMEKTLLRGRWQSTSSARIYLTDSVAAVSLLQLTTEQRLWIRQSVEILRCFLGKCQKG